MTTAPHDRQPLDDPDSGTAASGGRTDGQRKVLELVDDIGTGMLTTTDAAGDFISRPMSVRSVGGGGELWFVSDGDTRKVDQIEHGARVGITFSSRSAWVSLTGTAELVHDLAKTKEMWSPVLDAWFPDGPQTPGLVLVKVSPTGAQYWDSPGGTVATLISFAKAKVTGTRYDGGEEAVVDMTAAPGT